MGCRELDIRDQFRFVGPGEFVYARTRTFEKNRYKPVFHTVISNYRYYSPELGRWLSPDPIGEEGGYNLYAMVYNNAINEFDMLGLLGYSDFVNWWTGTVQQPAPSRAEFVRKRQETAERIKGDIRCCGGKPLQAGMECCARLYPYNPTDKCCYEGQVYTRKFTLDECIARRTQCMKEATETFGALTTQTIGPATLGTAATMVGGYFIGGMLGGGPAGAFVGIGVGAIAAIYEIGVAIEASDVAVRECEDSYNRCLECTIN